MSGSNPESRSKPQSAPNPGVAPEPDPGPKPDTDPKPDAGPLLSAPNPQPKPASDLTPKPDFGPKLPPVDRPSSGLRPDSGLPADLGLKSEHGPKADYGLKRRHAAIRLLALAGLAALIGLGLALWLFGQFLALASLPAILILIALTLAGYLAVAQTGPLRVLALTPLAFAIGLLPHAIFLIAYNLAVDQGGHGVAGYLPALGGLADVWEDGVLRLHQRAETWFGGAALIASALAGLALIAGLTLWSRLSVRLGRPARAGVVLVQALLLGAVATTVFSFVPSGSWSPNYAERLAADLVFLDQTRADALLAEKLTAAALAGAPAIGQAHGPAARLAIQALAARQPLDAAALAAARQLAADDLAAAADAGAMGAVSHIDPGLALAPPPLFADRPAVLALERRGAAAQARLVAARGDLAVALVAALGGDASPREGPIVDAFAAGLAAGALDRIAARFDSSFGPGLGERLGRLDDAPGHPLTQALAAFLETGPGPGWRPDSEDLGGAQASPAPSGDQPAAGGFGQATP